MTRGTWFLTLGTTLGALAARAADWLRPVLAERPVRRATPGVTHAPTAVATPRVTTEPAAVEPRSMTSLIDVIEPAVAQVICAADPLPPAHVPTLPAVTISEMPTGTAIVTVMVMPSVAVMNTATASDDCRIDGNPHRFDARLYVRVGTRYRPAPDRPPPGTVLFRREPGNRVRYRPLAA